MLSAKDIASFISLWGKVDEDAVMADADLNTEDIETLDAPEMPDEDGLAEGMDDSELSELLNDAESLDIQPFETEAGDY